MEVLLHRYRNVMALLVAIVAQLALLAYQVKSDGEVRLIRVWAVSAVTPLARVIEAGRSSAVHFFRDYFVLLDVREDNQRLKADLPRGLSIHNSLAGGERTVTELAEPHDMSLPAISKHLRVLEQSGLIERGRDAQRRQRLGLAIAIRVIAVGWSGRDAQSLPDNHGADGIRQ